METETKIQDALEGQHHGQHTSLVVAQRISTVLKADKIVVIDEGRIAAEGTHRELLQSSPIYQEIYDSQLGNGFKPEEAELASEGGGRMSSQPSQTDTSSVRASMNPRRPAHVGKIEKARDPRNALIRLLPYLTPFKVAAGRRLGVRGDLHAAGAGGAVFDGRGDRSLHHAEAAGGLGVDRAVDAGHVSVQQSVPAPSPTG